MTRLSKLPTFLAAASILALSACGGSTPKADANPSTESAEKSVDTADKTGPVIQADAPAGQLPTGVTPTAYQLDLVTDPAEPGFSGTVRIDVTLDQAHQRIWLHALEQTVSNAKAILEDGTEITATFTGDQADGGVSRLDFESPVPAGSAKLVLDYTAPYNLGLAGLYKVEQGGKPYLATQMEPIDARRMMPSFDEPRFKTPWSINVTAPKGLQVVSNGASAGAVENEDGTQTHRFNTTRPIQSYLVALVVGPYDKRNGAAIRSNALRPTPIDLRGFAPAGKGDKLDAALKATDDMLLWQEEYFDYPYPYGKLDIIAAPDFAYGAMENAGAIIYRESALLIDEKTSMGRQRGIFTIHAHELGHQWFGNLVTPKWWDDIWLNEAFATWISYKTMHDFDPDGGWERAATKAGLGAMSSDSLINARQIRNPIERNGDIMDGFDAITYRKGGHVLSMFESYLGEDEFRDGMRLHMRRFEDGVADVDDFMQSLADGSKQPDVVDSFKSFIFQPGIPMLDVQVTCAANAGQITIKQSRYAPLGSKIDSAASTWQVPFAATVGGSTDQSNLRQMLKDAETKIPLDGDCPEWVMPNADGAGYWRFSTGSDNWKALADNFDTLSPGEQITFADSLMAGFNAGTVSAADLLSGLKATSTGEWDAVSEPLGNLAGLYEMLPESDRPAMSEWLQSTYGPVFSALENTPNNERSIGDNLLRNSLYSLLVQYGDLPDDKAVLALAAESYIGLNAEPDATALSPDELPLALSIRTQQGGADFYDAAMAYANTTTNQREKRTVINTLANSGDARIVADVMKAVQGGSFSGNDAYGVMFNAMTNADQRETAWPIFKASFDNVVSNLPEIRKPQMARVVGTFCTAEKASAAAEFFESKAGAIPGYERSLAQGLERASLCAAQKAAKSSELAAALAAD
jgi:alanyl aminopeptidase